MDFNFYKYHGTGNDFILIRDFDNIQLSASQVAHLCDRHFGIGADGLILIRGDQDEGFEMIYYNSDGNESSMCGNGGRCFLKFLCEHESITGKISFKAIDGMHEGIVGPEEIQLKMSDVFTINAFEYHYEIDTGSPHWVMFGMDIENEDVVSNGRKIRLEHSDEGINVNYVEQISDDSIFVRTYERGVENETLSCGTGVTAAALAQADGIGLEEGVIKIKTLGGELRVKLKKTETGYTDIWLIGPAEQVFKGIIAV
jgi:diaminopimelate epimerase